ncbi:MAG TPA: cellulase family glycosylhydrolase [Ktedonobacteraceae bacterium]|nr:cellulase family glycosylhydrolase [Ktedonobacteraceae bacterium]
MQRPSQPDGPLSRRKPSSGKVRLLVRLLLVLAVLVFVLVGFLLVTQDQILNTPVPLQLHATSIATTPHGTSTAIAQGTPACSEPANDNGIYHFSPLHVDSAGDIVNTSNCLVHLLGWNSVGAFLGAGGAIGPGQNTPIIHTNIDRVAFNSRWYESDVYVPDQRMHYRAWLQKIVSTLESRGNYVMLDANTNFFEPPCGNDGMGVNIPFCPSEDQGRKDYNNPSSPYYHNVGGLELYQPIAIQALTDLAKFYANDPAVLFDVWNEPGGYIFILPDSEQNLVPDMNQRINIVRQYDPQALIIVFSSGIKDDLSYSQPDLVFDFHIYPNFSGISPVTHSSCSTSSSDITRVHQFMTALRKVGRAIFIGEWGHCYDDPVYNQQIFSLAQTYNAGLAYFYDSELFTKSQGAKQLNANGVLVQQDYERLTTQP